MIGFFIKSPNPIGIGNLLEMTANRESGWVPDQSGSWIGIVMVLQTCRLDGRLDGGRLGGRLDGVESG